MPNKSPKYRQMDGCLTSRHPLPIGMKAAMSEPSLVMPVISIFGFVRLVLAVAVYVAYRYMRARRAASRTEEPRTACLKMSEGAVQRGKRLRAMLAEYPMVR